MHPQAPRRSAGRRISWLWRPDHQSAAQAPVERYDLLGLGGEIAAYLASDKHPPGLGWLIGQFVKHAGPRALGLLEKSKPVQQVCDALRGAPAVVPPHVVRLYRLRERVRAGSGRRN